MASPPDGAVTVAVPQLPLRHFVLRPVWDHMEHGQIRFSKITLDQLSVLSMAKDGHCLFRAVATMLFGREATLQDVMTLRLLCEQHKLTVSELQAFGDGAPISLDAKVNAMLRNDWGNHPELQILATLAGVNFVLVDVSHDGRVTLFQPQSGVAIASEDAPHYGRRTAILRYDGQHYDLLARHRDDGNDMSPTWDDAGIDQVIGTENGQYLAVISEASPARDCPSITTLLPSFWSRVSACHDTGRVADLVTRERRRMDEEERLQQPVDMDLGVDEDEDVQSAHLQSLAPSACQAAASSAASSSAPACVAASAPPPATRLPVAAVLVFGADAGSVEHGHLVTACKEHHAVVKLAPDQVLFADWRLVWASMHKTVRQWLWQACGGRGKMREGVEAPQLTGRALRVLREAFNILVGKAPKMFFNTVAGPSNALFHSHIETAVMLVDELEMQSAVPLPSAAVWWPGSLVDACSSESPFVFVLQDKPSITRVMDLLAAELQQAEEELEKETVQELEGKDDEPDERPQDEPAPPPSPPVPIEMATAPDEAVPEAETPPSLFRATQEALALRIIEAFRAKLGSAWHAFTGVDFRIFVPAFNQLLLQTIDRVHQCGVVPAGGSSEPVTAGNGTTRRAAKQALIGHSHVWSYKLSDKHANQQKLDKLRKEAEANPSILFLLIADEAEWGSHRGSANDQFVNDPLLTNLPNVLVLLVTATPYALLTTHSRVPLDVEPFAYRMTCSPQRLGIDMPIQAGSVLVNDEQHRSTLADLRDNHRLPPSVLQPLEHVIPWFSPAAVVDGELVVLRSLFRQLLISAQERLAMASQGEAAAAALARIAQANGCGVDVSRDSSFDSDQFRLLVHADTPLRWAGSNKHAKAAPIKVRLQHMLTGLYLGVGSESTHPDHARWPSSVRRQAVLRPLHGDEWLDLQVFDRGAYFELTAQCSDGRRCALLTHTDSQQRHPALHLYFLDMLHIGEEVLAKANCKSAPPFDRAQCELEAGDKLRRLGYDWEFWFAPVQHGYRSLDTYIASSAKSVHGLRMSKLLRSDPLFHVKAEQSEGMAHLPEPSLANMRVAWAMHNEAKKPKPPDEELLLADYVYWMLHFLAFNERAAEPDPLATLQGLIAKFEQETSSNPERRCPLKWLQRWYRSEANKLLEHVSSSESVERLRALEIARKHCPLSAEQLAELARLRETKMNWSSNMVAGSDAFFKQLESRQLDVRTETEIAVSLLLSPLIGLAAASSGSRADAERNKSGAAAGSVPAVRGKMVVIRVGSNARGYYFHAGLRLAVNLLCASNPFLDLAVVPDFDEFSMSDLEPRFLRRLQRGHACKECACRHYVEHAAQPDSATVSCVSCGHIHRRIAMYEDLLHLPCVVLLNEKGRMGDTFPHSFATMDLRLRGNSQGNLRSVVQELGRMCRYVRPEQLADGRIQCRQCSVQYDQDYAYALIGFPLAELLHSVNSLGQAIKNPRFVKSKEIASLRPPKPARFDHPRLDEPYSFCAFKPKATMYDWLESEDEPTLWSALEARLHTRRFVLEAECQIGKTGTYLALIYLLQQEMDERPHAAVLWLLVTPDGGAVDLRVHPADAARLAASFASYGEVAFGKYHLRVAKERLCALLRWRKAAQPLQEQTRSWLFSDATGELAVSDEAQRQFQQSAAAKLQQWPSEAPEQLQQRINDFYIPLINWDGRMLHKPIVYHPVVSAGSTKAGGSAASAAPAAVPAAVQAPVETMLRQLLRDEQKLLQSPNSLQHVPLSHLWNAAGAPSQPASDVGSSGIGSSAGRLEQQAVSDEARSWRACVTNGSQRPGRERVDLFYLLEYDPYFASPQRLRISAPNTSEAERYFQLAPPGAGGTRQVVSVHTGAPDAQHCVHRWIFTCTYNRSQSALLDLSHAMQSSDCSRSVTYRRVIVVRSPRAGAASGASDFDKYVALWGGEAVIMELPPSCNFPIYNAQGQFEKLEPTTQERGCIGFARMCVQLLARRWKLDAVWMLDDNILRFYEIAVAQAAAAAAVPSAAAGAATEYKLQLQPVPFAHVLQRIEQLLDDNAEHNAADGVEAGSWRTYGMVGCARSLRPFYKEPHKLLRQAHSFKRCYSSVLINIRMCFEDASGKDRVRPLLFPPRPVWEDIEFQHLLVGAGLSVVRYDRIVHVKRNLTPRDEPYHKPEPKPQLLLQLQAHEVLDIVDEQQWSGAVSVTPEGELFHWLETKQHVSQERLPLSIDDWLDQPLHQSRAFLCRRPIHLPLALSFVSQSAMLPQAHSDPVGASVSSPVSLWLLVRAKDVSQHLQHHSDQTDHRAPFVQQLLQQLTPGAQRGFEFQWWTPPAQGELGERPVKTVPQQVWLLLRIARKPAGSSAPESAAVAPPARSDTGVASLQSAARPLAPSPLQGMSQSPPPKGAVQTSQSPSITKPASGVDERKSIVNPSDKKRKSSVSSVESSNAKCAKFAHVKSPGAATSTPKKASVKAAQLVAELSDWQPLLDELKAVFNSNLHSFVSPWSKKSTPEHPRQWRLKTVAEQLRPVRTTQELQDQFDQMDAEEDVAVRKALRRFFTNCRRNVSNKLKAAMSSCHTSDSESSDTDEDSDEEESDEEDSDSSSEDFEVPEEDSDSSSEDCEAYWSIDENGRDRLYKVVQSKKKSKKKGM